MSYELPEPPPVYWVPAKVLLRDQRFSDFLGSSLSGFITPDRPKIPIFVSHRWLDVNEPDPTDMQAHAAIRFVVEAICIAKGIAEQYFSYAPPPVALTPLLRRQIQEHRFDLDRVFAINDRSKMDLGQTTATYLRRWLGQHYPALAFEWNELLQIARVLEDVGFWYDYMCVPQAPFYTPEAQQYFEDILQALPQLIKTSQTLITWDKEANSRAWCLLEGVVAEVEGVANYNAVPNTNWRIAVFDLGHGSTVHPNEQMSLNVQQFAKAWAGRAPVELESEFRARGIACTRDEDLPAVCGVLSTYLADGASASAW